MRENRDPDAALALADFTARYVDYWRQTTGGLPVSHRVSDIPSPCGAGGDGDAVYWQPRAAAADQMLAGVEWVLALLLQPAA